MKNNKEIKASLTAEEMSVLEGALTLFKNDPDTSKQGKKLSDSV